MTEGLSSLPPPDAGDVVAAFLFNTVNEHPGEIILAIIWIVFLIKIAEYALTRRKVANHRKDVNATLKRVAPLLNDAPTAEAIWQEINLAQFQHMLTALQSALKQSGYQLTLHGRGVRMHPYREEQVADSLMCARELYWAPEQTPDEIERLVMSTRKSGHGKKMLREMLACCSRRDWHLTPLRSDWELQAYPLRQVEVRVRGGINAPIADLLPCLEDITKYVGDTPSPRQGEDIYRRGLYPSAAPGVPDVEYEVRLRQVDTPPGFFPDAAGCRLPPCGIQEKDSLRTTFKTQVTVFVQEITTSRHEIRTAFYQDAVRKIRDGEKEGADYDDDSGYAFFVNHTDNALVPRDAYGKVKESVSEY